jgi:hypothetical protein
MSGFSGEMTGSRVIVQGVIVIRTREGKRCWWWGVPNDGPFPRHECRFDEIANLVRVTNTMNVHQIRSQQVQQGFRVIRWE